MLDRRPMHADEAILADKFGTLLASGSYPYEPRVYHGPVLAYLAWIPAHLSGRISYPALTEPVLRVTPAIAGILLVFTPLLFAPVIGRSAAIAAAALAAVSPVLVYYSRYFIPEIPLALWTALFLAAILRRAWAAAGLAAALMMATKETAGLALAGAGIAYVATFRPRRIEWRGAAAFLGTWIAGISLLLAVPWKWGVLVQSATGYFELGTRGGIHTHPWYTYFAWMRGEAPILLLGAVGLVVAWRIAQPAIRFLASFAVLILAIYSALPYKTPWCAVTIVYSSALLAGVAIEALGSRGRLVLALAAPCLAIEAWLLSVPYAADPRNPWVYAHTGTGVFEIRDRVAEFARAAEQHERTPIDVYTRENWWPLPWYFRQYPNVRWWRQVSIPGLAAPIVLVSPEMEPDLVRKLYEGPPPGERELYMNLFPREVELRPGIAVRGYVAKSLWDRQ